MVIDLVVPSLEKFFYILPFFKFVCKNRSSRKLILSMYVSNEIIGCDVFSVEYINYYKESF